MESKANTKRTSSSIRPQTGRIAVRYSGGRVNAPTGRHNVRRAAAPGTDLMTNAPYPQGWRPTWARLAIFHEAESRRYKLYAVSESTLEHGGEQRATANSQPHEGFETLAEARWSLAEADPAAELARLHSNQLNNRTPPDGTEMESIRASGDPTRRASKADPGGVPSDLAAAFRAISAAVRDQLRGTALRIAIAARRTEAFLMLADHEPQGGLVIAPLAITATFIDNAVHPLGMTESDVLQRIEEATGPSRRGPPARTLWNEPPLVVSGMNDGLLELLQSRHRASDSPRRRARRPHPTTHAPAQETGNRENRLRNIGPVASHQQEKATDFRNTATNVLIDIGGWTKFIDEDKVSDVTLTRLVVRQIQRSFHAGTDADRRSMLSMRPPTTSTKWDAAAAATVEHTAITHGYEAPEWTEEDSRFLPVPTKALGRWRDAQIAAQPGPFLRRGIIIDARDLDGRTGDGREWVPKPI